MAGPHLKGGSWGVNSKGKRFQISKGLLSQVKGNPQTDDELQKAIQDVREKNNKAESERLKQRTRERVEAAVPLVETRKESPQPKEKQPRTRLEAIIEGLDKAIEADRKNSAQIFGLAADSIQKNQELLRDLGGKVEVTETRIPPQLTGKGKPKIRKKGLSGIVEDLDKAIQDDIRISSQIYGLAADSIKKNQELVSEIKKQQPTKKKSQKSLKKKKEKH